MDHPTTDVGVDEELQTAAKKAAELASENDYNCRVAASYVGIDMNIMLRQKEIAERARLLK
jgi:hypothetical protein